MFSNRISEFCRNLYWQIRDSKQNALVSNRCAFAINSGYLEYSFKHLPLCDSRRIFVLSIFYSNLLSSQYLLRRSSMCLLRVHVSLTWKLCVYSLGIWLNLANCVDYINWSGLSCNFPVGNMSQYHKDLLRQRETWGHNFIFSREAKDILGCV